MSAKRRHSSFTPRLEALESRRLLTSDFQFTTNPVAPCDVNFDGATSPIDVLILVNHLNAPKTDSPYFLDTNGDFLVSPIDVLRVINELNRPEGESLASASTGLVRSEISAGQLNISGSSFDDQIEVQQFGAEIWVTHFSLNSGILVSNAVERYLSRMVDRILITGGDGNDTLKAVFPGTQSAVLTTIAGGNGDDSLESSGVNSILVGGSGNDSLLGRNGRVTADYRVSDFAIHVDLSSGVAANDGFDGIDTLEGIYNVLGSEFDDIIVGDNKSNSLLGLDGNDEIDGGINNDFLLGGSKDDFIRGGLGNDLIVGGTVEEDDVDQLEGGTGRDRIWGGGGDDFLDGGDERDQLFGQTGDDAIIGGASNDAAYGGDGNDFIEGLSGDDELWGENGNDSVDGGDGEDEVDGGNGADSLVGGRGDDSVKGGPGNDILRGDSGDDTLDGGTGSQDEVDYSWSLVADSPEDSLGVHVNLLSGSASGEGTDSIEGFEFVNGSSGKDTIRIGSEHRARGGPGDDEFFIDSTLVNLSAIDPRDAGALENALNQNSEVIDLFDETWDEFRADYLEARSNLPASAQVESDQQLAKFYGELVGTPRECVFAAADCNGFGLFDNPFQNTAFDPGTWQAPDVNVPPGLSNFLDNSRAFTTAIVSKWGSELSDFGDNLANFAVTSIGAIGNSLAALGNNIGDAGVNFITTLSESLQEPDALVGFTRFIGAFGVLARDLFVTIPIQFVVSVVGDIIGNFFGNFIGRKLNADERAVASAVFPGQIDLNRIRIIDESDGASQSIFGSIIRGVFGAGSDPEGLSTGSSFVMRAAEPPYLLVVNDDLKAVTSDATTSQHRITTLVHELTHIYQRQQGLQTVSGRAAAENITSFFEGPEPPPFPSDQATALQIPPTEPEGNSYHVSLNAHPNRSWNDLGVEEQAAAVDTVFSFLEWTALIDEASSNLPSSTFADRKEFQAGNNPRDIVLIDVNNDSNDDAVVLNAGDDTLTIQLRTNFEDKPKTRRATISFGGNIEKLRVGDLNDDGWQDLIVADTEGNLRLRLATDASGLAYGAERAAATGSTIGDFALAEMTKDALTDIVVTDVNARSVRVLLNQGGGTFQPGSPVNTGNSPHSIVALTDFVAVANAADDTVTVYDGDQMGGLSLRTGYPLNVGDRPIALSTADLDGDGILELVTANQGDRSLTIINLLNNATSSQILNITPTGMDTGNFDVGFKQFDFGPKESPIGRSNFQVTNGTRKVAGQPFGWRSTTGLIPIDASNEFRKGDFVTRDAIVAPSGAEFRVDVSNGCYSGVVLVGSDDSGPYDQLELHVEGRGVNFDHDADASTTPQSIFDVNTLTIVEVPFRSYVTDGQLTISVVDHGGSTLGFPIAGLRFQSCTSDIAVSSTSDNAIEVLKNLSSARGTYAFASQLLTVADTGEAPGAIRVGHWDLNGDMDILVVNRNSAAFSVLHGTASETGKLAYAISKIDPLRVPDFRQESRGGSALFSDPYSYAIRFAGRPGSYSDFNYPKWLPWFRVMNVDNANLFGISARTVAPHWFSRTR